MRRRPAAPLAIPATPAAPGEDVTRAFRAREAAARRAHLRALAATTSEMAATGFAVAVAAVLLPTAVAYLSLASLFWLLSLAGR